MNPLRIWISGQPSITTVSARGKNAVRLPTSHLFSSISADEEIGKFDSVKLKLDLYLKCANDHKLHRISADQTNVAPVMIENSDNQHF